jgi:hypothetical protein
MMQSLIVTEEEFYSCTKLASANRQLSDHVSTSGCAATCMDNPISRQFLSACVCLKHVTRKYLVSQSTDIECIVHKTFTMT